MLRLARPSAIKAGTQAANQLQGVVETAPSRYARSPCPEDPCAGVLGAPVPLRHTDHTRGRRPLHPQEPGQPLGHSGRRGRPPG